MTYDKFYEVLKSMFRTSEPNWGSGRYSQEGTSEYFWTCGSDQCFEYKWVTGGLSGGNCWGDEPRYGEEAEPEPEMTELNEFLKEICPNLPFWQYIDLMNSVVIRNEFRESEYYGNYTMYATKKVSFKKLYEELKELKAI